MGQQRAGFAAFHERARDDCLRAVVAAAGNGQVAEDAVAEAFARAWASWVHCRPPPLATGLGGAYRSEHAHLVVQTPAPGSARVEHARIRPPRR